MGTRLLGHSTAAPRNIGHVNVQWAFNSDCKLNASTLRHGYAIDRFAMPIDPIGHTRSSHIASAAYMTAPTCLSPLARIGGAIKGPIDPARSRNETNKASFVTGVPLRRLGQAEEIAQTIVFLGSNEACFITGQIVGVDAVKMA